MFRALYIVSTLVCLTFASACDNVAEQQAKATEAQREANEKIASTLRSSEQKARDAQAEADKKNADIQADFMRQREEYRRSTQTKIADLDHRIDLLEAKAKESNGKARADLDETLKKAHALRNDFNSDYREIDTATAAGWDETIVRLNSELTDLQEVVGSSGSP